MLRLGHSRQSPECGVGVQLRLEHESSMPIIQAVMEMEGGSHGRGHIRPD